MCGVGPKAPHKPIETQNVQKVRGMTTRQMKTKEGKNLIDHCNTRKWASVKRVSMNEFPWRVPTKKWMMNNSPKEEWLLKKGNFLGIKDQTKGENRDN
jgi:hypothetical protein